MDSGIEWTTGCGHGYAVNDRAPALLGKFRALWSALHTCCLQDRELRSADYDLGSNLEISSHEDV